MPQTLKAARTKAVRATLVWLCCISTASYSQTVFSKEQLGCWMQWVGIVHSLGLLLDWIRAVEQVKQFSSHFLHQLEHGLHTGHGAVGRERPLLQCRRIPTWDLTLAFFLPQNPFVMVESHRNQAFQRWQFACCGSQLENLGLGLQEYLACTVASEINRSYFLSIWSAVENMMYYEMISLRYFKPSTPD